MNAKSIKTDLKKGLFFQGGKVSKITKIRALGQNMLQASKRGSRASKILKNHQKKSPRASKIIQNHENLATQNQENPRKTNFKNPGNKDAARWRALRAAPWIKEYMCL